MIARRAVWWTTVVVRSQRLAQWYDVRDARQRGDLVGGLTGPCPTIVSVEVEDGRITRIFAMRNPHQLAQLDAGAELTR